MINYGCLEETSGVICIISDCLCLLLIICNNKFSWTTASVRHKVRFTIWHNSKETFLLTVTYLTIPPIYELINSNNEMEVEYNYILKKHCNTFIYYIDLSRGNTKNKRGHRERNLFLSFVKCGSIILYRYIYVLLSDKRYKRLDM